MVVVIVVMMEVVGAALDRRDGGGTIMDNGDDCDYRCSRGGGGDKGDSECNYNDGGGMRGNINGRQEGWLTMVAEVNGVGLVIGYAGRKVSTQTYLLMILRLSSSS
ncbi:hypothetical protein HAX54_046676 [Datura stramonium]|uniref:Uncharacterized protein n=1 Tax=Datura stramonium TaxID=4076 RepID=A0ABS8RQ20_DATST|nr:hypothetical protein [Datura stramonium]